MENLLRKRPIAEDEPTTEAPAIKKEPVEIPESLESSESSERVINGEAEIAEAAEAGGAGGATEQQEKEEKFPILTSMITAPMKKKSPGEAGVGGKTVMKQPQSPPNYFMIFNAFRQFLNGYLAAGGDAHLANTLANYAAALPIPHSGIPPPPPFTQDENGNALVKEELVENQQEKEKEKEKETESSSDETSGDVPGSSEKVDQKPIVPRLPTRPILPLMTQQPRTSPSVDEEVTTEIQRLREAAFGRYKNVLCVICNEWICSRNRKNHIEAHLNYRPYKCSACDYARRREIFVVQHIKTQHQGEHNVVMLSSVDLNVALEVDRLADECVERTRKLIESMQEKKDGGFGEGQGFDAKALEMMMAEEAEKKVVVIESVSEVRAKVANYHRRQRTKVLKKIYDTDVAKQAELKIVKEEEDDGTIGIQLAEGLGINLADLVKMMEEQQSKNENEQESSGARGDEVGMMEEQEEEQQSISIKKEPEPISGDLLFAEQS